MIIYILLSLLNFLKDIFLCIEMVYFPLLSFGIMIKSNKIYPHQPLEYFLPFCCQKSNAIYGSDLKLYCSATFFPIFISSWLNLIFSVHFYYYLFDTTTNNCLCLLLISGQWLWIKDIVKQTGTIYDVLLKKDCVNQQEAGMRQQLSRLKINSFHLNQS